MYVYTSEAVWSGETREKNFFFFWRTIDRGFGTADGASAVPTSSGRND